MYQNKLSARFLILFYLLFLPAVLQAQHVVSVSPSHNSQSAALTDDISVTFDNSINASTIIAANFRVFSRTRGLLPGILSYNDATLTAAFAPNADFVVGDKITVILTDGIQTIGGMPLEGGYSWSFKCEVLGGSADFADSSVIPALSYPRAFAVADFNKDGNIDIALVSDNGSSSMSISFGNGDNSFQTYVSYSSPVWLFDLTAADINNDGWIDIMGVGETGEYYTVSSLYLNNGDGTFTVTTGLPFECGVGEICSIDLNNDGYFDFLSSRSQFSSMVFAHINNGDATFTGDTSYSGGVSLLNINASDFNNDGYFDLAAAGLYQDDITVFLNDGMGKMLSGISYLPHYNILDFQAADFNNDGYIDLATGNEDGEYMGYTSTLINDGDGSFSFGTSSYMGGGAVNTITCADINNDGFADLICGGYYSGAVFVLNNGDGTFSNYTHISYGGGNPVDIACADTDNDGDLDILALHQSANTITIYINGPVEAQCGDTNRDGGVNIGDAVYLVNFIFKGGPAPNPVCMGNINGDEGTNIGDVVYLVAYIFKGGPPPINTCCQ